MHRQCYDCQAIATPFEIGNAVAICIKLILKSERALLKLSSSTSLANSGAFGIFVRLLKLRNEWKKKVFSLDFESFRLFLLLLLSFSSFFFYGFLQKFGSNYLLSFLCIVSMQRSQKRERKKYKRAIRMKMMRRVWEKNRVSCEKPKMLKEPLLKSMLNSNYLWK